MADDITAKLQTDINNKSNNFGGIFNDSDKYTTNEPKEANTFSGFNWQDTIANQKYTTDMMWKAR